jgi:hypothetical protein
MARNVTSVFSVTLPRARESAAATVTTRVSGFGIVSGDARGARASGLAPEYWEAASAGISFEDSVKRTIVELSTGSKTTGMVRDASVVFPRFTLTVTSTD